MRKFLVVVTLFVLLLPGVAAAQAWQVDKSAQIPDVDKPGLGNNPNPPRVNDNSCWQAAASNILGAAGWGTDPLNLGTTQAKAENIYAQMNQAFGFTNLGCADLAITYWLYSFALNPAAALDYQPNASTYTDVTTRFKIPLVAADYNMLLTPLSQNKYVVVGFDVPPHCMTLTGGNPENAIPPGFNTQSIWHDSDTDVGNGPDGANDDVYNNDFTDPMDFLGWDLRVPNSAPPAYHEHTGQRYVVIAPGLSKPTYAMENYDAAYFFQTVNNAGIDTDGDGQLDELAFRVAGTQAGVFGLPQWGAAPNENTLTVHNQEASDKQKEIWLLVDYTDATWDNPNLVGGRPEDDIYVVDDNSKEYHNPTVTHSADEGQLLYYWLLDDQPAWEQIVFPADKYRLLTGKVGSDVVSWDLAVYCAAVSPISEPAGLAMIGMALLALRKRRS